MSSASVEYDGAVQAEIESGFVVLLGICHSDNERVADVMAEKISGMRIFTDEGGKFNLSLSDVGGEVLLISNFTLYADCKKGRRPSFTEASRPEHSEPLYNYFTERLRLTIPVKTGEFGADMKVNIANDGPVTIVLDSDTLSI